MVQISVFIMSICVFWWVYLAVLALKDISHEYRPVSTLIALVIMPAVLCISLGIIIGIAIGEVSASVREEKESEAILHVKYANYGALRQQTWPIAVEEEHV